MDEAKDWVGQPCAASSKAGSPHMARSGLSMLDRQDRRKERSSLPNESGAEHRRRSSVHGTSHGQFAAYDADTLQEVWSLASARRLRRRP